MNVKLRRISTLKPYKKNAKKHNKKQIEQIAESIKEFGFTQPVLIDEANNVIAGHGRILGAKKAGLTEVPTIVLTELSAEQLKAYRLVDNKLNESEWETNFLEEELDNLLKEDIDMELFGFDVSDDEEKETKKKKVEFEVVEKHTVTVTCKTDKEANELYAELDERGYECKVKHT